MKNSIKSSYTYKRYNLFNSVVEHIQKKEISINKETHETIDFDVKNNNHLNAKLEYFINELEKLEIKNPRFGWKK